MTTKDSEEDTLRRPDVLVIAQEQEAAFLEAALNNVARSLKKVRTPKVPGKCDYCEEPTAGPTVLFCCAECRDADEYEAKRKRDSGLR